MPPPPNPSLAELANALGEDNVRTLVRTFLREFPRSLQALGNGDRQHQHRIAHSMKSSSRLVGGQVLSQRMAEIEARLMDENGGDITPHDLEKITSEFEALSGPLRSFAGV